MNLCDLLISNGVELKRKIANEYAGPCPFCGGTDRFIVKTDVGRYWCRQCDKSGDAIQFLRDYKGLSYPDACQALNIEPKSNYRPPDRRKTATRKGSNGHLELPPDLWQVKGKEFVERCSRTLWGEFKGNYVKADKQEAENARAWLMNERGLSESTILKAGLGWNQKDIWQAREAWGLEPALNEKTGELRKLWMPRGLVIPFCQGKDLVRIRVRRPDPDKYGRYILLPSSDTRPMLLEGDTIKVFIVVESELDAWLLWDKAKDLVSVIGLGSASTRPDNETDKLLRQADVILNALDQDSAGAKSFFTLWEDQYENMKRHIPISAKDPGEMFKVGVDVRLWVQAGLLDPPDRQQEKPEGMQNRKAENPSIRQSENGQRRSLRIFSKVLQRKVDLSWSEDGKMVFLGGVRYEQDEIEGLKANRAGHDQLAGIHNLKESFEGHIIGENTWK